MPNKNPAIFVFCALACEARVLIDAWKLSKQPVSQPFAIYTDSSRVVVVSGMGKVAMAGAVGYALARFPVLQLPIMLNFGIAGHATHPCGNAYLANKVVDSETGKSFYPQFISRLPCPASTLISYPKPVTAYEMDSLHDMEASAFYEMALRFSSSELSHCLKVVSDNRHNPVTKISEADVVNWCGQQLSSLECLLAGLQQLRQSLIGGEIGEYQQILAELHFSATNRAKLRSLLLRWQVLNGNEKLRWRDASARDGKALLAWLEQELDASPFYL